MSYRRVPTSPGRASLSRHERRGFTLVELLVVMGIIGILIGVSLASYGSAITHARKAACASNLRNIGVGMLAFAGDHNQTLPESGNSIVYGATDPTTHLPGWTEQLDSYLGISNGNPVYRCPETSHTRANNAQYSYFNGGHAAYAEAKLATGNGQYGAVYLQKAHDLSSLIIGGDIAFGSFNTDDADKDDYTQDPAFGGSTPTNPITIPIHGGFSNVLFGDGHVESLKYFDKTANTTVYSGLGHSYLSPPEGP